MIHGLLPRGILLPVALLMAAAYPWTFPAEARGGDAPAGGEEAGTKLDGATLIDIFNRTEGELDFIFNQETGETVLSYRGGVRGSFVWKRPDGKADTVLLRADRVIAMTSIRKPSGDEQKPSGEEKKNAKGEKKDLGKDIADRILPPRLYAEGNVRLEGPGASIETDAFFYDSGKRRGVLVGVRGRGDLTALSDLAVVARRKDFLHLQDIGAGAEMGGIGGPSRTPAGSRRSPGAIPTERIMAFRAEVLRVLDLEHYEGEGITVSNCDYGVPHIAFSTKAARISPAKPLPAKEPAKEPSKEQSKEQPKDQAAPGTEAPAPPPEGTPEREPKHFIVTGTGNALALGGTRVFPLPPLRWNTEWSADFPIRSILPGHSSKFGYRLDVDWNVNWVLERTPLTRLEPARLFLDESRLDFSTDYRSARGFGWGPEGEYGKNPRSWDSWEVSPNTWNHYGESGYYAIRDDGRDRNTNEQFEDPDRDWAHVLHRQSIPYVGLLDVEYSERSDPNFLNEYFEPIAKEEKEQESLFYFRRPFRDNIEVTGLYKYKTDDFDSALERVPEGKVFLLEQPVARTGLYSGLEIQGAELRQNPPESSGDPEVRASRFDASNEWAYPFGFDRYVRLRPFADVRFSEFERGITDDDPLDRESLAAGITGSQQWSRIYPLSRENILSRVFGVSALKHEVIPKLTYRNLYWNSTDPEELISFDEVETVSTDERVEMSLRTELIGRWQGEPVRPLAGSARAAPAGGPRDRTSLRRIPSVTRSILDLEVSTDWFTHPARDNEGKRFSFLDTDLTFRPNDRLALRSRSFFDPTERMRFEATDTAITVVPVLNALSTTVGERFRRDQTTFTYAECTVEFSRKYLLDVYYAYDFEREESADFEIRLTRLAHKWAFEVVYGLDFNEGNEHSFMVNFRPIELLSEMRRREGRQDYRR
jgi:hypothetical protein